MKTSYNQLKKLINIDTDPFKLAEQLTLLGLEVESITPYSFSPADHFVTGEIISIAKHPKADKLSICTVNILIQQLIIVCGASNMQVGDKVIVALENAVLPSGITIRQSKIRDISSNGMLCSEQELGLTSESEGIWILPSDTLIGKSIKSVLPAIDYIYEFSITPNRGDCLSTLGIAREIAMLNKNNLNLPDVSYQAGSDIQQPSIQINTKNCLRYATVVIKNINVQESPTWLKYELYKYDIKPINNIVDIANYVMLQTGQPLHCFDLETIEGNVTITNLDQASKIKTFSQEIVDIPKDAIVIQDQTQILAIGGVIGSYESGVSFNTKDILIEAGYFDSVQTKITTQEMNISTEASYRFSRDTDIENIPFALNMILGLIIQYAGGEASKINDLYPTQKENKNIEMSLITLIEKLGFDIPHDAVLEIFQLLNFELLSSKDNNYLIKIPSYRNDCNISEDIIEEIARVYGYDKIPVNYPKLIKPLNSQVNYPSFTYTLKDILALENLTEMKSFSFVTENQNNIFEPNISSIAIENPLSAEFSHMRTSVLASLIPSIKEQYTQGNKNLHFFEIGNIHYSNAENFKEESHLLIGMTGQSHPEDFLHTSRKASFFDLKGKLESLFHKIGVSNHISYYPNTRIKHLHPHQTAQIFYNDIPIGYIGSLHPKLEDQYKIKQSLYLSEINLEYFEASYLYQKPFSYHSTSKYPFVFRDLAFIFNLDIISIYVIEDIKAVSPLIKNVKVMDIYQDEKLGNTQKSITFSLILQDNNNTLTDTIINNVIDNICLIVQKNHNGILRQETL